MESALENLFKSFTRYFMPGLIILLFAGILPAFLFIPSEALTQISVFSDAKVLILGSLVLGYILDAAGTYRFTLHFFLYKNARQKIAEDLAKISSQESSDPDCHINRLWHEEEKTYERIFVERAEWVLVLESAFSLLFSASVILAVGLSREFSCQFVGSLEFWLCTSFVILSFLISSKGIQRMIAHNTKLKTSVEKLYQSPVPNDP